MSNTRQSPAGSKFRQEKYASADVWDRGIGMHLMVKRCPEDMPAEDREIVFFLQWQTHQAGGVEGFIEKLLSEFPDAVLPDALRALAHLPGKRLTLEEACRIETAYDPHHRYSPDSIAGEAAARLLMAKDDEDGRDSAPTYTVAEMVDRARQCAARQLSEKLLDHCVNPTSEISDEVPMCFRRLKSAILELMNRHRNSVLARIVETEVAVQVREALEFAQGTRRSVLVSGGYQIGKNTAAEAWCLAHPGRARYVRVPPTGDDVSFLRHIAKSLGLAAGLGLKAQWLRARIEDALRGGNVVLVLGAATYLFPQAHVRDTVPQRINWLLGALIRQRVPVVMIANPSFAAAQARVMERTSWTPDEFNGHVRCRTMLPSQISVNDLKKVLRHRLPGLPDKVSHLMANRALVATSPWAALDSLIATVGYFSRKAGREIPDVADFAEAMAKVIDPSEDELSREADERAKPSRKRRAQPLQADCAPAEDEPEPSVPSREISPSPLPRRREGLLAAN